VTVLPTIRLQPQRHKRIAAGHPWIYSNEIVMNGAAKALSPGSLVDFLSADGAFLGRGTYNPHTLIAGRILTQNVTQAVDQNFFAYKISTALKLREQLCREPYYRLIHAEGDGLPGLIIDRFGPQLSVQLNTAGMDALWPDIKQALIAVLQPDSIVLHNESSVRTLEGLERVVQLDHGSITGPIAVQENGLTYFADLVGGQKTGWYFDQRDNHALMARFAVGRTLLDLYTHAGGFALLAAKSGATQVTGIDSSEPALTLARQAAVHNKLDQICAWHKADVYEYLEQQAGTRAKYDIVIADPPPFVKSRKDIAAGARGYRKLARLSAMVTAPGGLLYIASCSHNMDLARLTAEVALGLNEARRSGQIIYTTFAAADHPVHPHLPESAYLKGLVIRLD
jgi:23S rRNA (cytosine1962-C5)-methyltransferase